MLKGEKQKEKLIEDYQKAITEYGFENEKLEQNIKDLKTNLFLNQNLLYNYILKSSEQSDEAKNLVNNTKEIWEKTQSYIEKKNLFELKIARLKELIEDTPTKIREEINRTDILNHKIQDEITEKDEIIKKLKIELDKTRKNALFKCARIEIYVTDPTKISLEIGQELLGLKSILTKLIPMHNKKMEDTEKLKKNVDELKDNLDKLKKKSMEIYLKLKLKKSILEGNYNKEDANTLFNTIEGYDQNFDKSEEEDEDEDDYNMANNNDDTEEGKSESNLKKIKAKEKELDRLTEIYNKLKDECQQYENKINEHKKIYKEIKIKMKNLKKNID